MPQNLVAVASSNLLLAMAGTLAFSALMRITHGLVLRHESTVFGITLFLTLLLAPWLVGDILVSKIPHLRPIFIPDSSLHLSRLALFVSIPIAAVLAGYFTYVRRSPYVSVFMATLIGFLGPWFFYQTAYNFVASWMTFDLVPV